jgi:CBS-domain-containing membrane protein
MMIEGGSIARDNAKEWYYSNGQGEKHGPIGFDELRALWENKQVRPFPCVCAQVCTCMCAYICICVYVCVCVCVCVCYNEVVHVRLVRVRGTSDQYALPASPLAHLPLSISLSNYLSIYLCVCVCR